MVTHSINYYGLNQYYLLNATWNNWSTYITNGKTKIYFNDVENLSYQISGTGNPTGLHTGRLDIGKSTANFVPYSLVAKIKEIIFHPSYNLLSLNPNIRSYYTI